MNKNMENYKEIKGDLIKLGKEGMFNIISHGANCLCRMGAGIAYGIAKNFPDAVKADNNTVCGDASKLGDYSAGYHYNSDSGEYLTILNCYTQYSYKTEDNQAPVDYDAIENVLTKINNVHKYKSIGLPLIGCGLAGGDWNVVKEIIQRTLVDMDVTIVHYDK